MHCPSASSSYSIVLLTYAFVLVMQTCSLVLYSAHAGNNVYQIKEHPSTPIRLRTSQVSSGTVQVSPVHTVIP